MPPWQGGGNMIADVTFDKTVYQPIPNKFEAGTGNIADAVGLGAAIDYVNKIGIENIARYEHDLLVYGTQQLAAAKGAKLRVIPVDDSGQVLLDEYSKLLNPRTRLVAVTQVSNALGTVTPVKQIVELARRAGARTLVDGAQSVSHMRIDVQDIGADFFVFSGHKLFGPCLLYTSPSPRDS